MAMSVQEICALLVLVAMFARIAVAIVRPHHA
jgi:hypothetical protein